MRRGAVAGRYGRATVAQSVHSQDGHALRPTTLAGDRPITLDPNSPGPRRPRGTAGPLEGCTCLDAHRLHNYYEYDNGGYRTQLKLDDVICLALCD